MKSGIDRIHQNFNPLFFQASLAAGGVALMAFNYLQFAVPHGKGLIEFSDVIRADLNGAEIPLYSILIAVMLAAIIIHIALTVIFLRSLAGWLRNRKAGTDFLNDPYRNVTIFPVIGSLSMSANVLWGSVGFFVPWGPSGLQSLMLPSLICFAALWIALLVLEYKVVRVWLTASVDTNRFNFVWLLDAFAFGLVSLTGSGIAFTSNNETVATLAAGATVVTLVLGISLLGVKMVYLTRSQIRVRKLQDSSVLPALFLPIPISCLFGISLYRLASNYQSPLSIDVSGIASFVAKSSYVAAVAWLALAVFWLSNYFRRQFARSKYSAPQWGIV